MPDLDRLDVVLDVAGPCTEPMSASLLAACAEEVQQSPATGSGTFGAPSIVQLLVRSPSPTVTPQPASAPNTATTQESMRTRFTPASPANAPRHYVNFTA